MGGSCTYQSFSFFSKGESKYLPRRRSRRQQNQDGEMR